MLYSTWLLIQPLTFSYEINHLPVPSSGALAIAPALLKAGVMGTTNEDSVAVLTQFTILS